MSMRENPFAPPRAESRPLGLATVPDGEAESIRRRFLNYESSIKAIGWLYLIGGTLILIGILIGAISLFAVFFAGRGELAEEMDNPGGPSILLVVSVYGVVSLVVLWIGNGLRTLHNGARIAGIVCGSMTLLVSVLSLNVIAFLIQILFLYYLATEKGRYVCSAEYHEIIRKTPHVKPGSWVLIVVLVFVALAIAACVALPLLLIAMG